jgi:hypothetical protein
MTALLLTVDATNTTLNSPAIYPATRANSLNNGLLSTAMFLATSVLAGLFLSLALTAVKRLATTATSNASLVLSMSQRFLSVIGQGATWQIGAIGLTTTIEVVTQLKTETMIIHTANVLEHVRILAVLMGDYSLTLCLMGAACKLWSAYLPQLISNTLYTGFHVTNCARLYQRDRAMLTLAGKPVFKIKQRKQHKRERLLPTTLRINRT